MTPMDVVILCGGKGTRLRSVVSDRPKPMAALNEKPFLEVLIGRAAAFGFNRFILCAGYMGEMIERHFADPPPGLEIKVSLETEPLDTAGAVKNAQALIRTPRFLVMNGDSFCGADLGAFAAFHAAKKALASVAVTRAVETGAGGAILKDAEGKMLAFREKAVAGGGYVNAGLYIFEKAVLERVPAGAKYSLERDLFPSLAAGGGVYVYETPGALFDIGTPEGYRRAGENIK